MRRALLIGVLLASSTGLGHERITTEVTYSREVVRILGARCLPCHGDGGQAIPLLTYEDARPWAKAIREEVLSGRMPPWPPRTGVGALANDGSLSPHMIDLIVAWTEGGAPEGDRADLPASHPPPCSYGPLPGLPIRRVSGRTRLERGGVLHALRVSAPLGASVEVRAVDRARRPLLWIPRFDPAYAYTYVLREPLELAPGARVEVLGPRSARVDLTLSEGSAPSSGARSP